MQLKPLYSVRFHYPADWAVELTGPGGKEEQHFFFAEGTCTGTITGHFRGANHPRRRTDLTFTPDFQGMIETDDGAMIMFDYQGYGRAYPKGRRQIICQLLPAKTGVLLGPSGAGRSTLINRICGAELMRTREIHRPSGEGRHMTSHRQLVQLPQGGMIIDTPGLREAQLWEGEDALANVFEDIEDLALRCRFTDCLHVSEPGCAIKAAVADGRLDAGRFQSYRKLQRELRAVARKSDARLRAGERRKWKQISVANRVRERYLR